MRIDSGATQRGRAEGQDDLGAIAHSDGDAVAAPEAEAVQLRGQRDHVGAQLAVAQRWPAWGEQRRVLIGTGQQVEQSGMRG